MRILWFSHRDIEHPSSGGDERAIYEITKRLVASDNDVTWVACRFPESQREATRDGIRILRPGHALVTHLSVASIIKSTRPEVIVDDLGHVIPWFSEELTDTPGTAFFLHLHARTLSGQVNSLFVPGLTYLERQYRHIYPRWPFVTISTHSLQDLVELGIPERRVTRIPLGVDLQRFHPSPKNQNPIVVYFGGFRDYKRPWVPVQLYKKLQQSVKGVKLVMIGDGPIRARVQSAARDSGIEFVGKVNPDRLSELVARSWLNVHSSVSEGWGLSIIEASACGTPTVAFAVPGVAETIENGFNGILVPDGNLDELADAATGLLNHLDDWPERSRRLAERYTWDATAANWLSHLERTLTEK
jgi:glycosyltransferase involved in cell wall biosynthesis